jgi:hypothetical protein
MMKTLLAFLIFAAPVLSQNQPTSTPPNGGCGPSATHFDVTTSKSQHSVVQPEQGKALVFIIEDIERGPTMRVGLDGAWVGANKGRSYLSVSVDPGEHQFCTNWQSGLFKETAKRIGSAVTLTTEPGKVYYLRTQVYERSEKDRTVKLEPVEAAEGQFLVSSSALSNFHPKK